MLKRLDEIAELYQETEEELLLVDDDLVDDELVDDTVVELFPEPVPIITEHWGLLPHDDKPQRKVGLLDFGLKPNA